MTAPFPSHQNSRFVLLLLLLVFTNQNKTVWRRRFEHTQQQNPFAYNSLVPKIRKHAAIKSVRLQQLGDEESNTRSNKIRPPTTIGRQRFQHVATKIHSPCNSLATRKRTQNTKILSSHSTSLETNCEFKLGEKRKKLSGRNN